MINPDDVLNAIDKIPSLKKDIERGYLGASEIGNPCSRYLWLKHHRYFKKEEFDPEECEVDNLQELKEEKNKARLRRLFQRGHDEEFRFEGQLHEIGAKFITGAIDQGGFREGFFSGHWDGDILLFSEDAITEYKTHNKRLFNTLKRGNLEQSFPKHFGQAQCYMKKSGRKQCIYLAVCKDDDRLFCDVIAYDEEKANAYFAKAEYITMADRPPERIATKPTAFACKFCHAKDVCFGFDMPRVNCRNCTSAVKHKNVGSFGCEITNEIDPRGWCESHSFNPHFMQEVHEWEPLEFHPQHRAVEYKKPSGEIVINGKLPFGIESHNL